MLGTFDLTNWFHFVTVISTFDTAYLFSCDKFISSSTFVLDKSFSGYLTCTYVATYWPTISKQTSLNKPTSKRNLFKK